MKPKLKKQYGLWYCKGNDITGHGELAIIAYLDWLLKKNRSRNLL